jgi:hypothetical protein
MKLPKGMDPKWQAVLMNWDEWKEMLDKNQTEALYRAMRNYKL